MKKLYWKVSNEYITSINKLFNLDYYQENLKEFAQKYDFIYILIIYDNYDNVDSFGYMTKYHCNYSLNNPYEDSRIWIRTQNYEYKGDIGRRLKLDKLKLINENNIETHNNQ